MEIGENLDAAEGTHHTSEGVDLGHFEPLPTQRLAPLSPEECTEETAALLESLRLAPDQPGLNIFATLAHHPRLLKRWAAFGGVLLLRGELSARDRELLILRTAWNCRAHYEWAHHVPIGRAAGLSDEEIARVTAGAQAAAWPAGDALLLRAADELHHDAQIGDATWAELAGTYDAAQLVELCMVVGQYHLVAFTLNSLGVQLEGDQPS